MLPLGLAAVAATAAFGVAGFGPAVQIAASAVATAICPGLVWPVTLHHIHRLPPLRVGTSALTCRGTVMVRDVSALGGRVRIGGE